MKLTAAVIIAAVLLSMACKADYDVQDVATPEHLGTDHHDDCEECEDGEHTGHEHEHEEDTAETGSVHEETGEHDALDISGSDRHVHEAGVRNHGTGWFFNQPWAATFIWGKIVRDIIILLILSAAVFFISGYRRKSQ